MLDALGPGALETGQLVWTQVYKHQVLATPLSPAAVTDMVTRRHLAAGLDPALARSSGRRRSGA